MRELNDPALVTRLPAAVSGACPDDQEEGAGDLTLLAEQLAQIAEELRRSSGGTPPSTGSRSADTVHSRDQENSILEERAASHRNGEVNFRLEDTSLRRAAYAQQARQIYTNRRKRCSIFGNTELFGEPGWDILLDLYIAHSENKQVSVSSACIGSAAPPTTGLRWLGVLAEADLVLREHDPADQRRVLVRLTDKGLSTMDEYFASTAM